MLETGSSEGDCASAGPLAGIRVLDFSRYGPGLLATMMLADLGAEVIHVDEPLRSRRTLRDIPEGAKERSDREQLTYAPNRGKRSIVLDLKSTMGRDVARSLAATVDIVYEGFRPGVAERLGIDYASLSSDNPGLIYCSISGYGQAGPNVHKTGHDLTYLAETGALFLPGGVRPVVPPLQVADFGGGSLHSLVGVLSALHRRHLTGQGGFVDAAITDGLFCMLTSQIARHLSPGRRPHDQGGRLTGAAPFYNLYRTADDRWLAIACTEPHFWRAMCEVLDAPDLVDAQADPAAWQTAIEFVAVRIIQRTLDDWCDLLTACALPHGAVKNLDEVLDDDHFAARGMFLSQSAGEADVVQVAGTVRLDGNVSRLATPVPRAGEHSRAILHEYGLDYEKINALLDSGAVEQAI